MIRNFACKRIKVKEFLLYFLIFFPYFTTFFFTMDTAPYALVYSTIILLSIRSIKLPLELVYLFLLFLISLIVIPIGSMNILTVKIITGYLSVFVISSAVYFVLKRNQSVNNAFVILPKINTQ
jgi:hypothetical protein